MRYVIMNSIADYSNFNELIESMADFNKDYVQAYINWCIQNNLLRFAQDFREHDKDFKVHNLFNSMNVIENIDDLANIMHCSLLMTKAPITRHTE